MKALWRVTYRDAGVRALGFSLLLLTALFDVRGAYAMNHAQPSHPHTQQTLGGLESATSPRDHLLLIDHFEYQDAEAGSTLVWDASAWFGTEQQRLWLTTSGERTLGTTAESELQVLYGHVWNGLELVAGVRQDFKPASPQTWAVLGGQGIELGALELASTLYLGEASQSALSLEAEYEFSLSDRLFLLPTAEVNLYSRNDPARGLGAGLSDTELALRLRYELTPQLAPYVGVSWTHAYGNSADMLRDEGDDVSEVRWLAGIRLWF